MQYLVIFGLALVLFVLERIVPGRELPNSAHWYARAVFLNLCQLGLVITAGFTWQSWLQGIHLVQPFSGAHPVLEGLVFWVIGTFVFYWWHRIRHRNGWWEVFHQVHHSPKRIEVLTSFYKHPLEALANSIIISFMVYGIFGGSIAAAAWYNIFAVAAEFFYHMNIATPYWIGYVIQRPEHHSIHHQRGVHRFNFGDLTLWDRLFGTFKDTRAFVKECGFANAGEERFLQLLAGKDVQK